MNEYGKLIEPPPVPFSFGAPGWYVLGALLLLILFATAWLCWVHYQKNKYRQSALQWLNAKQAACNADNNYNALIYEATMLMKRVAMKQYGRAAVAGKREDEFIAYINSTWKAAAFDAKDRAAFSNDIYSNQEPEAKQAEQFTNKVKHWIKEHRYKAPK